LKTAFIVLTLALPLAFAQQSHTPPTPAQMVANKVARLTAQEVEATASANAAFWAILTPDQQTKYKIFRTEKGDRRLYWRLYSRQW
jgi:hypothetical protein